MNSVMLRDSAVFSFSRYVLLGLSFLRNFVVARLLDPESYGYWVIAMLALTYGDQIHLGLRHAGDKEIPYYQGQGRPEEGRRVANAIFGGILVLSATAFISLAAFIWLGGSADETAGRIILFAGVIVVADQVSRFYLMIMRVKRLFLFSSRIEIVSESIRTLLVCLLAYFFALWGAIAAFLAVAVFMAVYTIVHFRKEFVPEINRKLLMKVLNLGFSLFGAGLLFVLLINADRLFAATILSKEQLGIYGVAALVAQLPMSFTQGISTVVYPTLSETFGKSNTVAALYPLSIGVLRSLSFTIPFVAVTTYFGSALLVGMFLPAYRDSIRVLVVLLPGAFFVGFVPFLAGVFGAVNRAKVFLLLELFVAACIAVLFPLVQEFFDGAKGVGIAMTAGMLVYAAIAVVGTFHLFSINPVEALKQIVWIYLPSVYCMIVTGIIVQLIGSETDALTTMGAYGIFLVAATPLMYFAHRVLNLRRMFSILRNPNG